MTLKEEIEKQIVDEIAARDHYRSLFEKLQDGGYYEEARQVNLIADAEDEHANTLMTILQTIGGPAKRAQEVLGRISQPLDRPFPKTYGDWANLAENIKEKYPDDPVMRASVNYQLGIIAREEETEPVVEEVDVDEAKRWLAGKAGELGIR